MGALGPQNYHRGGGGGGGGAEISFKYFTLAPMLYITYIVGVQDQLLVRSLVSIENSVHF